MKQTANAVFNISILIILFAAATFAQVRSNNDTRPPEVDRALNAVNKVLVESGSAFNDGLQAYADGRLAEAGAKFNRSVEVFLYSTLNIQREQRLQSCYNQLIETVYRIEFPSDAQPPQVRSLASTCGWSVDAKLADDIARLARPGNAD